MRIEDPMSAPPDEREMEKQLSEHLASELNPQLGRAGRGFDAEIRRERQHRGRFMLASSASLIAACVLIAAGIWWLQRPGATLSNPPQRAQKISPPVDAPRDVQQLVAWQTIDEGVENIPLRDANPLPVHRLRRDAIQQVEWVDPTDKAKIRLLVPVQQVFLIKQETY
jgi:hypothetical protein